MVAFPPYESGGTAAGLRFEVTVSDIVVLACVVLC